MSAPRKVFLPTHMGIPEEKFWSIIGIILAIVSKIPTKEKGKPLANGIT